MHFGTRVFSGVFLCGVALVLGSRVQAVDIEWVTVGVSGNAADDTGRGAVAGEYQIGKYEVTVSQYTEFLNAVAATDTNALYNAAMGSTIPSIITRSGSPGSYTYSTTQARTNMPVTYVSFFDSVRFANWLHNGQPTGPQDGTTTEDGAYTFSAADSVGPRNSGATVWLPDVDEWYKAAYFDPSGSVYYDYPAGSDETITCALPGATANTANCSVVVANLTAVGSYTGSASPNGTFDQGGNVWEWNDEMVLNQQILVGGSFISAPENGLSALSLFGDLPSREAGDRGFRVARVPEPGRELLLMTALLTLGCVSRPPFRRKRQGNPPHPSICGEPVVTGLRRAACWPHLRVRHRNST